jgi:hypothetical protein
MRWVSARRRRNAAYPIFLHQVEKILGKNALPVLEANER